MEKLSALLDLGQRQATAVGLFLRAEAAKRSGDYTAASAIYREYVEAALTHLRRAIEFNRSFPDKPYSLREVVQPLVNGLLIFADIEWSRGQSGSAEELRERALGISREYLGRQGTAEARRSLAGAFALEGRFNEAIAALYEVRDMLLETRDNVALARVAIDLADFFHWLGDYDRAKDEIDHAQSLIEPLIGERAVTKNDVVTGLMHSVASILGGRGNPGTAERSMHLYREFVELTYYRGLLAKALQRWDEAEHCFEKVLPDYRGRGVAEVIEFELAQVQAGRGEQAVALTKLQGIAPSFERAVLRVKRPVLQRAMAECLLAAGRNSDAAPLLKGAIEDLRTRQVDPAALWRAQDLHAQVLAGAGAEREAMGVYADALETVRGLRAAPLGYRLDSTFLADKVGLYARAIQHALRCGQDKTCAEFMDGLKSRTLSAVLGAAKMAGGGGPLAEQFDALSRELNGLEYAAYRDPAAAQPMRRLQVLKQRADLLERIRITDPRWRGLSESPRLDLAGVQAALVRRSQAALSMYDAGSVITSVLLWQSGCHAANVPIAPSLRQRLNDYAANLARGQPDVLQHDLSVGFGVQATDLVAQELLALALDADSLVVVPHGLLHLLPWAAILHEGRRLFERVPVGIYPNLSLLAGDASVHRGRTASIMGVSHYQGLAPLYDLPAVTGELRDITALYRAAGLRVRGPYQDADATETVYHQMLQGLSGSGHLLHLSCHGVMVPKEPMNSGLLLTDAKLDAAEVAQSRLPFDEVVLSACSTGWRPTQVGGIPLYADEILGVPGAFLEAGAQSVLVSIPKAEQRSAAALVTAYHSHRIAGEAPLYAFQSAQRQLLTDRVHPSTWVGFSLYSYV